MCKINLRKFDIRRIVFIVLFALSSEIVSAQNAVTTLCGSGIQGNPLSSPNGLCISPDGQFLYLADYSGHRIKKITVATGSVTNFAGTGSVGNANGALLSSSFNFPTGIAIASDNSSIYVADNNNCLIRKINIAGNTVSTIAGVYNSFSYSDNANGLLAEFNQPTDIAIAPGDSVIYISDTENHIIRKMNLNSTAVSTVAGTPGSSGSIDGTGINAKFKNPAGISLSLSGQFLYVADAGNHKIRKIDLSGFVVTTIAGAGFSGSSDNAVGTLATFNVPQGVKALPNDSLLYVMDSFNHLIRAINLSTTSVSTIAGSVSTLANHFADNSIGLNAKFWYPMNAVVSANGSKLYICDQQNYRIRTMNTDFVVSSVSENLQGSSFRIFPNPVQKHENIQIEINFKSATSAKISLVNLIGSELYSENIIRNLPGMHLAEIPATKLNEGIYFIKIKTSESEFVSRIVVSGD